MAVKECHKLLAGADNVYTQGNYVVMEVLTNNTNYKSKGTPKPNYTINRTYLKATPELKKVASEYSGYSNSPITVDGAKIKSKFI